MTRTRRKDRALVAALVAAAMIGLAVGCAAEEVRTEPVPEEYGRYAGRAFELLDVTEFRRAYEMILPEGSPAWLRKLEGPSPPSEWIRIGGRGYVVVRSCQPHACRWNRVILLFAPSASHRLVGGVLRDPDEEGPRKVEWEWLGAPTGEEKRILQSLAGLGS